jgi:hypothetical protein
MTPSAVAGNFRTCDGMKDLRQATPQAQLVPSGLGIWLRRGVGSNRLGPRRRFFFFFFAAGRLPTCSIEFGRPSSGGVSPAEDKIACGHRERLWVLQVQNGASARVIRFPARSKKNN